jgi:hypothetical protein
MFDASLCASMIVGPPQVSMAALKELREILDGGNGGSAGSWKCPQKEDTFHEPDDENGPPVSLEPVINFVPVFSFGYRFAVNLFMLLAWSSGSEPAIPVM